MSELMLAAIPFIVMVAATLWWDWRIKRGNRRNAEPAQMEGE